MLQLYEAPNSGRSGGVKGVAQDKLYVSQCKRCGWGIFKPSTAVWSSDPMGLVHENPLDCRPEVHR